jgi:branched-chain amino acid transport system permease protein
MIKDWLAAHPRLRPPLFTAALILVVLVFTQFVFSGQGQARGTPAAVLFNGLVFGLLNALLAAGLVLVYRTTRIINFAQTAIGSVGATFTFQLIQLNDIPFLIAFPLGVLVAGVMGVAFDLIFVRRFFHSARLVLTVLTIAVAGLLSSVGTSLINYLPFFPKDRSLDQAFGTASIRNLLPFPGLRFKVGGFGLRFGFVELFAIEVALLALVGLALFFRYTRAGVGVRAMAENSERATLLGISVGKLSTIVWGITGLLGGVGVIMTGSLTTPGAAAGIAPAILLPALVAAVVARMESIPTAAVVAVAISVVTQAATFSYRQDTGLVNVALLVVLGAALLVQRRTLLRSDEGGGVSWQATEEQRAIPAELRHVTGVRVARWGLALVVFAFVVAWPFLFSTAFTSLGGVILLHAIVALSIVVLTGWAGQVSLGQFGLAAVGGAVAAGLTGRSGLPFWVAVPLATVAAAAVAAVVGLPALRIRGLFLAVVTFAFSIAVSATLFKPRYFEWLLPEAVERPSLFFIDFEDEKSMYFLCLAAFLLAVVVVANLRRSRFGRVLIAMRENEANLQSFGISVVRTKLTAFAVSGALAGFAGAIFVHQQRGISEQSFVPQRSVDLFLIAVLGGVSSIPGALLGSAYFNATTYFFPGNLFWEAVKPGAVAFLLWVEPGGLIAVVNHVRDSVLRIIAQRRQIVVPSLFADVDPDALARKKVPLAEPLPSGGLAALPATVRYTLSSELYLGKGERTVDKLGPATPTKEAAAIGAAAESANAAEGDIAPTGASR